MQRYKKVGFVRFLDIWFDRQGFEESDEKIVCLHSNTELPSCKYDFKLTAQTFLLDISKTEKEIFAGFEYKSCRYAINKAKRDGVRVWAARGAEEKERYLGFQRQFCRERGLPEADQSELESLEVYCAETKEGEFLGGCAFIVSADQKTVRYKYGATAHRLNANEAILWKAICDYRERGFQFFDFGGCVPTEDKDNYYYSHYQFKRKFGGKLAESYTYFRTRGLFRAFYYGFICLVKLFFKGDVNRFTIWANKKGMIH